MAPEAAETMRITARDLLELGIADEIIAEPAGGAHEDSTFTIAAVGDQMYTALLALQQLDKMALFEQRYAKYRAIGRYQEQAQQVLET
jgi:acetyl-CoA carboxylase carboxyl transferase subunit alpha